jgi:hypothetical protein
MVKFRFTDFIVNEDDGFLNTITFLFCICSLVFVILFLFIITCVFAPKLLFGVLGLCVVGSWYRMYKLGYITFTLPKNTKK